MGLWSRYKSRRIQLSSRFSGPCALIIGNEGRGISKLTVQKCDKLIKIPMVGKINSLNASVAGGIMMYEVFKRALKIERGTV